jgi:hypothetical protein
MGKKENLAIFGESLYNKLIDFILFSDEVECVSKKFGSTGL